MNNLFLDDEGNLNAQATFARAGIQYYLLNGKKTPVLREPKEVKDAAPSFYNLPVTLEHPKEGIVNNDNKENVKKGFSEQSKFNQGLIYGKLKISDADAVKKAKTTHPQISCGYKCELIEESGEWTDEYGVHGHVGETYPYEYKQKNIQGNHIALVEKGRAGAVASIQIDNNDESNLYFIEDVQDVENIQIKNIEQTKENDTNGVEMTKKQIIFDDEVFEIEGDHTEDVLDRISKLKSKLQETADSLDKKQKEKNELQTKIEEYEEKMKTYEDEVKNLKNDLDSSISQKDIAKRLEIWNQISDYLDSNEIDYKKGTAEIKKLYLSKYHPEYNLEDASEEYINGLWSVLQPKNKPQQDKASPSDALNSVVKQPQINRNRDK